MFGTFVVTVESLNLDCIVHCEQRNIFEFVKKSCCSTILEMILVRKPCRHSPHCSIHSSALLILMLLFRIESSCSGSLLDTRGRNYWYRLLLPIWHWKFVIIVLSILLFCHWNLSSQNLKFYFTTLYVYAMDRAPW